MEIQAFLSGILARDIETVRELFRFDDTVKFRRFENQHNPDICGYIIFTEVLVNNAVIDENVVRPLLRFHFPTEISDIGAYAVHRVVQADETNFVKDLDDLALHVLIGDTVILLDGCRRAMFANSKRYSVRGIGLPETENAVNGPKESFNELIVNNISLVRRKVLNPKLKFQFMTLGRVSKTRICISYIEGLANEKTLTELKRRLSSFEIDSILDVTYLSELIKDAPLSPFKTVGSTERPDVVAAKLLEGRIAILCDGTPFVLTVPFLFLENFQASEDYYSHYFYASFTRALRFIAFFLTVSLPSLYIALICYHKEMIPKNLLLSIAKSRAGVPFPAVVEMLLLLLLFDLIREAGIRLPKPVGFTISMVGAVVLGQSIVSARIVSAEMIILVALCGITSFLTPKLDQEILAFRLLFLFFGATLGIYGYALAVLILFLHISSLKSFGVEYLSYLPVGSFQQSKDVFIRAPWWLMRTRPWVFQTANITRFKRKETRK